MNQPMIFGVWQINGVNQTQMIGGNHDNTPKPKPRRHVTDCDGCGEIASVGENKFRLSCCR